MSAGLDVGTLRAVAAQLDEREIHWRRACSCILHEIAADLCQDIAADLRTQAIRAEQSSGLTSGGELHAYRCPRCRDVMSAKFERSHSAICRAIADIRDASGGGAS